MSRKARFCRALLVMLGFGTLTASKCDGPVDMYGPAPMYGPDYENVVMYGPAPTSKGYVNLPDGQDVPQDQAAEPKENK